MRGLAAMLAVALIPCTIVAASTLFPANPASYVDQLRMRYGDRYNNDWLALRFHSGHAQCLRYYEWGPPRGCTLAPRAAALCDAFRKDAIAVDLNPGDLWRLFDTWNEATEAEAHKCNAGEEELTALSEHATFFDRVRIRLNRRRILEATRQANPATYADSGESEVGAISEGQRAAARHVWLSHPMGPIACRLQKIER